MWWREPIEAIVHLWNAVVYRYPTTGSKTLMAVFSTHSNETIGTLYWPSDDSLHVPNRERFESPEGYYVTLLHELTHSTGHESRLNRKGIAKLIHFGSRTYSQVELTAEMGAACLCGHAGIENTILDNSASYIDGWLKRLKSDNRLIVHVAAAAQKAADFILGERAND